MFFHQYSTETCARSNPRVGSSQNNVTLLYRIMEPRGNMITASIKVVGVLEFDGMASICKLLINVVMTNKPKVLTGLNQHARKRAS